MIKERIIENNEFESEKYFATKPLEKKGLNKCYIDLISADVFGNRNFSVFKSIKNIFNTKIR